INIPNLAQPYSAVCSGLTGLLFSGLITVGISLIAPANYDFAGTRAISVIDPVDVEPPHRRDDPAEPSKSEKDVERDSPDLTKSYSVEIPSSGISREELERVFKRAAIPSLFLTLTVMIIIPLPMYFSHYIFSHAFFTFWVACSMIWALLAGAFCISALRAGPGSDIEVARDVQPPCKKAVTDYLLMNSMGIRREIVPSALAFIIL
ncbi:hypothetical protein M422DRAFT_262447, partial [Sphaerobolus stellatus SS14]